MSTFPDGVYQYGGMPVGGKVFDGMWGGQVYFVDYDNGTERAGGLKITDPLNDIQAAIDLAGTDATIYVRPRVFSSEDPQQITPRTAENFHIDAAKTNMSLIGTGKGLSHAAAHKAWIGGYSGLVTPVLTVYAPGCVIENFRAQPPSSATYGIFYTVNDDTYDGGNTTFISNDFHDANSTGGINCDSTWQMSIIGNRFVNCDIGILIRSFYSVPQIWEISHNYFTVTTGEVLADVYATGGLKRLVAYRNIHAAEQPTGGDPNKYYAFAATSSGMIAGDYFGAYDLAAANLCTLNGVNIAGCYSIQGLVVEAS